MFCNAFTVSYSLCGFYEIMRIHLFYFPEVDPAGKSDMRELIKSGGFRADGTIEGICYNDFCSFQPFFYGLLTPNSLIPFPEKPFCDLQGTEKLNFFSYLCSMAAAREPIVTGSPITVMSGWTGSVEM